LYDLCEVIIKQDLGCFPTPHVGWEDTNWSYYDQQPDQYQNITYFLSERWGTGIPCQRIQLKHLHWLHLNVNWVP
jgi:hypothetical protein